MSNSRYTDGTAHSRSVGRWIGLFAWSLGEFCTNQHHQSVGTPLRGQNNSLTSYGSTQRDQTCLGTIEASSHPGVFTANGPVEGAAPCRYTLTGCHSRRRRGARSRSALQRRRAACARHSSSALRRMRRPAHGRSCCHGWSRSRRECWARTAPCSAPQWPRRQGPGRWAPALGITSSRHLRCLRAASQLYGARGLCAPCLCTRKIPGASSERARGREQPGRARDARRVKQGGAHPVCIARCARAAASHSPVRPAPQTRARPHRLPPSH